MDNATEPTLNPYSWNEYANMLYVDQPFSVGFSNEFESSDASSASSSDSSSSSSSCDQSPSICDALAVNSTVSAASNVWKLLQAFYAQFPQYENRDFGIFTESYGGHYGPEFASYFESQNKAIASGSATGQNISLVALGINNGWYDSKIQEKAYIDFSLNNTYAPLINQTEYTAILDAYNAQCVPALQNCTGLIGDDEGCLNADLTCMMVVDNELDSNFNNPYDIRPNALQPPAQYAEYLSRPDVMKAIGAKSEYQECSDSVSSDFYNTGDRMFSSLKGFEHNILTLIDARSLLPALSSVVQSGVTTLIWAGDADYICNWFGGLGAVEAVNFTKQTEFQNLAVSNYTVNGTAGGTFKTVDNLSWLRVFGAGHEVPFYRELICTRDFES